MKKRRMSAAFAAALGRPTAGAAARVFAVGVDDSVGKQLGARKGWRVTSVFARAATRTGDVIVETPHAIPGGE